ncbi:MAG TPA: ABC transporter permease subunit [Anaerolineae bacterium]|nr:ABC transporter permease subunit [Anaerolineae bacterium]
MATNSLSLPTSKPAPRTWSFSLRWTEILQHAYIIFCCIIFVLPFIALFQYSLQKSSIISLNNVIANYSYVFGSFKDNLITSLQVSALAIIINFLISFPAAYAIVRYTFPGKRFLLSLLSLSLYVPAVVLGFGLVLTYNFGHIFIGSIWGLVFAMAVGTYPLMLTPLIVALKDLPPSFEEAALCLGASRWQTITRIVLPLIGQGIAAGVLLSFIIIFNEYLVTLFVVGTAPGLTTASLRVFNLVRTAGLLNTTAALAATMQIISFVVVLVFFRIIGTRYLKGTYLI